MQSFEIKKYPRTPHLEGSRLQPGDEDLSQVPFAHIAGRHLVVEEKVDGANSAVSFDADGQLLLQSRGHYLAGGYRERHYALMKQVVRRLKYVRSAFLQCVDFSEAHWVDKPIVPNQLAVPFESLFV